MLKKKQKYDLVHAFFGIPCGYIAMKLKLPYIVSLRGSDVPFYNKRFQTLDKIVFKRLSRRIWKKAKAVVANSQGLKKLALSSAPGQKIGVIYNGVDINEFEKDKGNKNDNNINIISIGRLIPRKGYGYLIEALSGLEGFSLKLIGEGNSFEELQELAKKKNVNVDFSGRVEHEKIYQYLNQADLFVLPSLNEGMSNSMLEAMACRLPVIGTDVGGSKELIDGNGFIVEKANSAELRKALLSYKRDKTLIKKHGDKSKKLAEKLAWENVVRDYFTIYNKIEFN
jgi:glycosyltransferase involved in cell wall biosynthesis